MLFSALIKDSTTRMLILEYEDLLLFPSLVLEEAQEHLNELLKKSGMKSADFNSLLKLILNKVKIVPTETLYQHRNEALEIVKGIDPDDAIIVACALANPGSIIWSNDKGLKKQNKVKVLNTAEIIRLLY